MDNWQIVLKVYEEIGTKWTDLMEIQGEYVEKAAEIYSEVAESLVKNGIPKGDVDAICRANEVKTILYEVEKLSEAGYKIDKEAVALYKLYERMFGNVKGFENIIQYSTSDLEFLSKCSKSLTKMGKYSNYVLLASAFAVGFESWQLIQEGKEDEAGAKLRKYGLGLAGGWILNKAAMTLLGPFLLTNPLGVIGGIVLFTLVGTWVGEGFSKFIDTTFGLYDDAGAYTYPVDPLIFDLNGDGVKTVALADGVHFDFDKNGFAEKIGWVSPEDGLLVRDLDKNGKIDSGRELMGDLTEVADDLTAANGFEALAHFDTNADGVINARDAIYRELQIWQDKNQNGTVDDGELMSLEEAGVAGINLAYDNINITDESGNGHSQKGTYIRTDGTVLSVEDVWFEKDAANTVVYEEPDNKVFLEETDEIQTLPDIQGTGNQYSLHQAMLRDETGVLKQLVEDYMAETDRAVRKSMLPEIIYVWTGVNEVEVTSRGDGISDARKLAALEVITGRDFNSAYGANPVRQAGAYLEQAFDKLVELYFGQLEMQTTYANEYAELFMNLDIDENGDLIYDLTSIAEKYKAEYESNPVERKDRILDFVDNLRKTGMDLMIGKDKICETFSSVKTDLYHAIDYKGDDVISGGNGDDIIIGERGNDLLKGGNGNDIYYFDLGDGQDTIWEDRGNDRIVFGEGITAEDIGVSRDAKNLYLTNKKSGDRIGIRDFFDSTVRQVEEVTFADGTIWGIEDLKDKARYYRGTDGNDQIYAQNSQSSAPTHEDDYLYGGAGDDVLYGNSGNDELYGEEGDDTLDGGLGADFLNGGTGNDTLRGGQGDDTYYFDLGDGQDTIWEDRGNDRI
ncbi:MAG: hypothetical protein NC124_20490, partial [Clostridium sp.]|nr:hypothetical protein [Clostridium sp.]